MYTAILLSEGTGFNETSGNLSTPGLRGYRDIPAIYCPYDESSFRKALLSLTNALSVKIDTSSIKPQFEISSETSFIENMLFQNFSFNSVDEENFINEILLNDDYIVNMAPVNIYRVCGKIRSIITAKPDSISIEGLSDDGLPLV